MLRLLTHSEINKVKWDETVLTSNHGMIYATSAFLDNMSPDWSALVAGDYETIQPLPIRKKWGFRYVFPPAFSQQLGIISKKELTGHEIASFIQKVKEIVPYAEMNLNHANFPIIIPHDSRKNYLLDLSNNYAWLQSHFSRSALRNIKKSEQNGIRIQTIAHPDLIIDMHRKRFKDHIGAKPVDYDNLLTWLHTVQKKEMLYCLAAFDASSNMIAGSVFILFKNRITFLLNGNSQESLKLGATHALLDRCIQTYAGSPMIIDFEGSDHPEFARFYEQYGATPEYYPFVKLNRLPWWARWAKQ